MGHTISLSETSRSSVSMTSTTPPLSQFALDRQEGKCNVALNDDSRRSGYGYQHHSSCNLADSNGTFHDKVLSREDVQFYGTTSHQQYCHHSTDLNGFEDEHNFSITQTASISPTHTARQPQGDADIWARKHVRYTPNGGPCVAKHIVEQPRSSALLAGSSSARPNQPFSYERNITGSPICSPHATAVERRYEDDSFVIPTSKKIQIANHMSVATHSSQYDNAFKISSR